MHKINILVVVLLVLLHPSHAQTSENKSLPTVISTAANSWVFQNSTETEKIITKKGIQNWEAKLPIRTYFKITHPGSIDIGFRGRVLEGESTLKITLNGATKTISLKNPNLKDYFVGTFQIQEPGYAFVELEGLEKTGKVYAEIEALLIGGNAAKEPVTFVKDDVYWGRRGPSVHLSYQKPEEAKDIVYFYNEMTIPEGEDVIGSYFMANGFAEGYFGIQVNSATERRILFSVWSPFKTDDPNAIPEDQKIKLLSKGKNVITGEFGNEGSGGQSRKVFPWKSDTTYRFLLKAEPSENNSTDYTAYFYAPELGSWELIASFRRPKTSTYVTRPHSFLENFIPSMGNTERQVMYSNQWIYDTSGTWFEMTQAKFTADATARKGSRLDYAGGTAAQQFYLKNCGFFSNTTEINKIFNRAPNKTQPNINFDKLPQ